MRAERQDRGRARRGLHPREPLAGRVADHLRGQGRRGHAPGGAAPTSSATRVEARSRRYGEQLYQRFQGLTDEARVQDLAANKKELLQYFQSKPDLYQCEAVSASGWFGGVKALRAPEYAVAFAELVIE